MGYYTNYKLEITGNPDKVDAFYEATKIKHRFRDKLLNYEERSEIEILHEMLEATFNSKFYNHEQFFLKLSSNDQNRDLLFTVDGEGEESGDIWKKYFKNGKMFVSQGRIVFDDFDESKLT